MSEQYLLAHLTAMPTECDDWPFGKTHGYGQVVLDGRQHRVHVLVCTWYHGPRPSPAHVASHSCGRGQEGCFAAAHLSWQTRAQDGADRVRHGRTTKGERNVHARLTADQVRELRARAAAGETYASLSRAFGISDSHARDIALRKRWRHI